MTDSDYDVILVGGGHNALVCAAYLAKAKRRVLVCERRHLVGGACVTEELWDGYRVNTAAYVVSLFLPEIAKDLDLHRRGYKVLPRTPSSFTPTEDGRHLFLGADAEQNRAEIGKFSQRDAERFGDYEALLTSVAEILEPTLSETPPDVLPWPKQYRKWSLSETLRNWRRAGRLRRALAQLGSHLPEAIELLTGAATPILNRWFESDVLKATLATDAIIGTFQPPSAPGTAYVLLHHVMGEAGGARGVWGYVQGGMGRLSDAIAEAATEAGATIRTSCSVEHIVIEGGRVVGVQLDDGKTVTAPVVASSIDPHLTFERLIDAQHLPDEFRNAVGRIDYSSASMKINLAVRELPDFTALPGTELGPQHRGTIHIGASTELIERGYEEARAGRPSERPIIEMTIPTSVDPSLAPEGHHILSLFVQYAPYQLAEGTWDDTKEAFADRCLAEVAKYAPNVPDSVVHRQVLSPVDLERTFSLTGGNIFQGAMPLHQLFSLRPVPGWGDYRTPVRGLYVCGSAAHPGGGVMGAAGRNAAREILRDN